MTTAYPRKNEWNSEYGSKGIPSSFRLHPSGSVEAFWKFLHDKNHTPKQALDIGCGTGRNSVFLAQQGLQVNGIDIASDVIATATKKISTLPCTDQIHLQQGDITAPWPYEDNAFDLAIDTFCFKHQISPSARQHYRQELTRVLQPKGLFLLTLADITDGYYGALPDITTPAEKEPGTRTILDPENNIESILYTKDKIIEDFKNFHLLHHDLKSKTGLMHGKEYLRATHVFYFELR